MKFLVFMLLLMITTASEGKFKKKVIEEANIISLSKVDSTKHFMNGLSFKKPDGSEFRFSEVEGKVLLLDFWATWCGPCKKQHPIVEELKREIDNSNFELITVSIDRNLNDWQNFFDANHWEGINIYVGWDEKNPLFQIVKEQIKLKSGKKISKVSVPQYYLVDKSHKISKIEDIKAIEVKDKIRKLLAQ